MGRKTNPLRGMGACHDSSHSRCPYRPAAPTADRRHEHAAFLTGDATQPYPRHRAPGDFAWASTRYSDTDDLRRFQIEQQEDGVPIPTMNSIVSALRFFFTHTLDRQNRAAHGAIAPTSAIAIMSERSYVVTHSCALVSGNLLRPRRNAAQQHRKFRPRSGWILYQPHQISETLRVECHQ